MTRVQFTERARDDVREIGRYVAHQSQSLDVALRLLDSLGSRCEFYAENSELGERCPTLGEGVRRFVVGNYVVFYVPLYKGIQVLRVLHGSRDVPMVWRD